MRSDRFVTLINGEKQILRAENVTEERGIAKYPFLLHRPRYVVSSLFILERNDEKYFIVTYIFMRDNEIFLGCYFTCTVSILLELPSLEST